MKCKQVHTRLLDYLEGNLPPQEIKQVKDHLKVCQACSDLCQQMGESWQMVKADRIGYQPFLYTRIQQRLENRAVSRDHSWHRWVRLARQPVIFFLVLFLGIAIGIQLGKDLGGAGGMAVQNQQSDYLEAYADNQYWNGLKLESLEQEMFYPDTLDTSNSLNQQKNPYE